MVDGIKVKSGSLRIFMAPRKVEFLLNSHVVGEDTSLVLETFAGRRLTIVNSQIDIDRFVPVDRIFVSERMLECNGFLASPA